MGSAWFVVQLSYYGAETTRHMHILDEASIRDEEEEEEEGRLVIGTDCVLWLRRRVLLGRERGSIWAEF